MLLKSNGEHDHVPQPEDIQTKSIREKMKSRAVNETTVIARIYFWLAKYVSSPSSSV